MKRGKTKTRNTNKKKEAKISIEFKTAVQEILYAHPKSRKSLFCPFCQRRTTKTWQKKKKLKHCFFFFFAH